MKTNLNYIQSPDRDVAIKVIFTKHTKDASSNESGAIDGHADEITITNVSSKRKRAFQTLYSFFVISSLTIFLAIAQFAIRIFSHHLRRHC